MNLNRQTRSGRNSPGAWLPVGRRADGFTLTELAVVLGTVGLLAALVLPAMAATQPRSKASQCLNNMRQLALGWTLYAGDNAEKLVLNSDRSAGTASQNWTCPAGIVLDWTVAQSNTNTLYLSINMPGTAVALLAPYVAKSAAIFHCPADNYVSAVQRAVGWAYRMRSCAMNGAMGAGSKWFAPGSSGNWPAFYSATKITDLNTPEPSTCFVVLDEHPDSNDDAIFYINPADANGNGTTFTELPGSLHDNAAGMNFADGHADLHRWYGAITCTPVREATSYLQGVNVSIDSLSRADLTWLAQHTPQK